MNERNTHNLHVLWTTVVKFYDIKQEQAALCIDWSRPLYINLVGGVMTAIFQLI